MSTSFVEFKSGSTFSAVVTYTPEVGDPANLTGFTITSSVRTSDNVTHVGGVVVDSGLLKYKVSFGASATLVWAAGLTRWDIKLVNGSTTITPTWSFKVVKNVT